MVGRKNLCHTIIDVNQSLFSNLFASKVFQLIFDSIPIPLMKTLFRATTKEIRRFCNVLEDMTFHLGHNLRILKNQTNITIRYLGYCTLLPIVLRAIKPKYKVSPNDHSWPSLIRQAGISIKKIKDTPTANANSIDLCFCNF